MADKLTLLELHLHAEDNEFTSDMQLSSDVGDLLRRRLGFGSGSAEEVETEPASLGAETSVESDTSPGTLAETTTDGGDTVQIDETEETEEGGAVVEIDADADLDEGEDSSGGRSKGKALFVLLLLVGLALLVRWHLSGDDIEDEFEEL